MRPLSKEENKSYEEREACHICKKKFCLDENDDINENDENNENDEIIKMKMMRMMKMK